jgi:hypothetical protein
MIIRVDVERLVLHNVALAHADRRRLLVAVEQAIAEQATTAAAGWDLTDAAVPVLHAGTITLPAAKPAGTQVDSLAAGIAGAATAAVAQLRGGTP